MVDIKMPTPPNQLTELISILENIKESERKKIANEIHDGIGGNIAAIKMVIDSTLILTKKDPNLVEEKLLYLQNLVNLTLKETRRISNASQSELIDFSFDEAIEGKLKEWIKKSNCKTEFYSTKHNSKKIPLNIPN
jgi:signal transduction histidine kinase